MRVLALAQDFGFGPISMLNRAILNLPDSVQVDFWLPGHLAFVLDKRANTSIHPIADNFDLSDLELSDYSAAIVACDYDSAARIREHIPKVIVYDMLFWFWPELHSVLSQDILVIAQNFPGVLQRAAPFESVKVVGPLLPAELVNCSECTSTDHILVNLGGFKSPHHTESEAAIYAANLLPALEKLIESGVDLCIAGGSLIVDCLANRSSRIAQRIAKLKHGEICDYLSSTQLYLTIPGLGSIYEAIFSGVPTFILPPTNLTQTLQMNVVTSRLPGYFGFAEYSQPAADLSNNQFEGPYISDLFKHYEANADSIKQELKRRIQIFRGTSLELKASASKLAHSFILDLGGPGEDLASSYVAEFLNS